MTNDQEQTERQELLSYFKIKGARNPGDMEDDLCGRPPLLDNVLIPLRRFKFSRFFDAFKELVKNNEIVFEVDKNGYVFYALPGMLPSQIRKEDSK